MDLASWIASQSELPASVVSVSSPAAGGYNTFPTQPDYLLNVVGSGVGAINTITGNTDYSASSGDHAGVFQSAITNLLSGGGPTAGAGGVVLFKGKTNWASQVTLYPNIALRGSEIGYGGGLYGSTILSTFNGSCIVITGDARGSTFVDLSDFTIYGTLANASQNGIEFNASGGSTVLDASMSRVFINRMGKDGLVLGGTNPKLFMHMCWIEFNAGNGITDTSAGGNIYCYESYFASNTGNGYDSSGSTAGGSKFFNGTRITAQGGIGFVAPPNANYWEYIGGRIDGCTGNGMSLPSPTNVDCLIDTDFHQNGNSSTPQLIIAHQGSGMMTCRSRFTDGRTGGAQVTNHVSLGSGGPVVGQFIGCHFDGSQSGDAIAITTRSYPNQKVIIRNCLGFNNVKGLLANPWNISSSRVGVAGSGTGTNASTVYTAEGTDLFLNISGGTGVSITITDPNGSTVLSGLSTYQGILPVNWGINFGAYSVAPSVKTAAVL